MVDPSINISIGKYGEKYNASFHKYFKDKESVLNNCSTFYQCAITNEGVVFNQLNDKSKIFALEINDNIQRNELLDKLQEEKTQFFLKDSLFDTYKSVVNLETGVNNFHIININIILSSFEEYTTLLLSEITKQIEKLSNSGQIQKISINVFAIISKTKGLLNSDEQILTFQNLEEIKAIKNKYNTVFHKILFIDNLNTDAVVLNINENSIGFILNEFVTYLMTNQSRMFGNLLNSDYFSFGLSTLLFDEKYFNSFFKCKIINRLVDEQINQNEKQLDSAKYNQIRNDFLYSFLRKEIDLPTVIDKIKEEIDIKSKHFTLSEYKFLISNLLGKHNDMKIAHPFTNFEKISLYDLIFSILNGCDSSIDESDFDILEHKLKLDNIIDLENRLEKQTQKLNNHHHSVKEKENLILSEDSEINSSNDDIENLKKEISELSQIANKEKLLIDEKIVSFKEHKIESEINKTIVELKRKKNEINKVIEELDCRKNEIKRKNFFIKIFKPNLKEELLDISDKIYDNKTKIESIDKLLNNVNKKTTLLFEFIEELESLYTLLIESINSIENFRTDLNTKFSNIELSKYFFVKNVIDTTKLDAYYDNNADDLQSDFKDILNKIIRIDKDISLEKKNNAFLNELDLTLSKKIDSIISFNIIEYLNGDYDSLNLLKQENLESTIDDLLKIANPFINTNSSNPDNFHCLMLHNNKVERNNEILRNKMNNTCFSANVPQQIYTEDNNKFSIVKIGIIKNLNHIVKYNESSIIHKRVKANTIIN